MLVEKQGESCGLGFFKTHSRSWTVALCPSGCSRRSELTWDDSLQLAPVIRFYASGKARFCHVQLVLVTIRLELMRTPLG